MKKLLLALALISSINLNATVIIAHRGENKLAPENSIEGANIAWKNGVKFVEADFHEISTGEIICIHGKRELKKYTGIEKEIPTLTISEIPLLNLAKGKKAKKKIGIIKSAKVLNKSNLVRFVESRKIEFVKVPTMEEMMATVPQDGTLVFEIKSYSDSYAKKVDDARQKAGLRKEQVIIIAFNADYLKDFNSKYKGYKTLWLYALKMKDGKINYTPEEAIAKCKEIGASGVDVGRTSLIGQQYISEIKKAGFEFYVWTVNNKEEILRMNKLGVDGITTDTATIAKNYLKEEK